MLRKPSHEDTAHGLYLALRHVRDLPDCATARAHAERQIRSYELDNPKNALPHRFAEWFGTNFPNVDVFKSFKRVAG